VGHVCPKHYRCRKSLPCWTSQYTGPRKTGAIAWQDRAFARAQLLHADNKLILLDEDGTLAIASVSPAGLKVLARASILENLAWTPPTLIGKTLYVRDRKTIAAYDLS
jgi:hypothetical protein